MLTPLCLSVKIMKKKSITLFLLVASLVPGQAQTTLPNEDVEGPPLGANAARLVQAMEFLGVPLAQSVTEKLNQAIRERNANAIQRIIDPHALVAVFMNPEVRVKVKRGPARAVLRQGGYTPFIVKVFNDSTAVSYTHLTLPTKA